MRPSDNRLKPQDVLLALKLAVLGKYPGRMVDIAGELGISQSEVSHGMERLMRSGLLDQERSLMRHALLEFLLFGLKYVYPAQLGQVMRGTATAHSAKPLASQIKSDQKFVWADGEGSMRGQSVSPLYESVPLAARKDPVLHELLALVDAIRIGRAREQEIARKELKKRLEA